jgi:hypothetical protein
MLHHVVGEVEGVDLGLGQVVSAGDGALLLGLREPQWRAGEFLLPSRREDDAEVLAGRVGRAAGVRTFIRDGALVDPVQ